jgi:hypothetical protein
MIPKMKSSLPAILIVMIVWSSQNYSFNSKKIKYNNHLDEIVFSNLKQKQITPSSLCSDEVFFRRAYLSVVGTIPTQFEVQNFVQNSAPDKRKILIDTLLEMDGHADYWTLKWSNILRIKSEFPGNLWPLAAQVYAGWVRNCLKENMPYDQFAKTLLTSSGSNFFDPPVNFYRVMLKKDPVSILDAVCLALMGTRSKNWTPEQRNGMAAFFTKVGYKTTNEWKEEIVFFNEDGKMINPITNEPLEPVFLDGQHVSISPDKDPRDVFADWLVSSKNPWFSRNIVNRIWYWFMGKEIIQNPDDIRPDKKLKNAKLLIWLEKEFVRSNYDMKHICRLILNSRTFQLSSDIKKNNINDNVYFSHYYVHQLDAEVLIDIVCKITGTTEVYSSQVPEPYTFIPEDENSVSLTDGSITSPFLDLFGRPSHDTGLESERNNEPSMLQRLHFLNSSHIQKKLQGSQLLKKLINQSKDSREIITNLYLSILSRYPVETEQKIAGKYFLSSNQSKNDSAIDLAWALISTKEFCCQH